MGSIKLVLCGTDSDSSWVAFKHSWPWPWPRIGSYGIPSCITYPALSTHPRLRTCDTGIWRVRNWFIIIIII